MTKTCATKPDLTKLRELAEKATPGPWIGGTTANWNMPSQVSILEAEGSRTGAIASTESKLNFKADATYIAATNPATVIALLDRIEALEKALKPFADEVQIKRAMKMMHDEQDFIGFKFKVGDLRRAAAAMKVDE